MNINANMKKMMNPVHYHFLNFLIHIEILITPHIQKSNQKKQKMR